MKPFILFNVPKEFSRFCGGRKKDHGPYSGQEFWETVTRPLLAEFESIVFELTGGTAYSSGFLDEAFGEIGRVIGLREAKRRIKILAEDDALAVATAWERIKEASEEAHAQ